MRTRRRRRRRGRKRRRSRRRSKRESSENGAKGQNQRTLTRGSRIRFKYYVIGGTILVSDK